MKNLTFIFISIFLGKVCVAQSINELYSASVQAKHDGDYQKFKQLNLEALKLHPSQPTILYNTSVAYHKLHLPDSSRYYLEKLISWNSDIALKDEDFDRSTPNKEYWEELETLKLDYKKNREASKKSHIIEGMHHFEDILIFKKDIYLTDILNKSLVKINLKTNTKTIVKEFDQFPIATALNKKKGSVWVSLGNILEDVNQSNESFIYEIDLTTGEKLSSLELPESTLIGSMVYFQDKLWATNSKRPEILVVDTRSGKLLETIPFEEAFNLQGITLDEQNQEFYLSDYIKGICSFNLKSPNDRIWYHSDNFLLKGFDGLKYIGNSNLIAIQNNSNPKRVVKLQIGQERIVKVDILDNNLAYKGEPTNMCYVKKKGVFYIANSAWPFYDKDKKPIADIWENQEIRLIPNERLIRK